MKPVEINKASCSLLCTERTRFFVSCGTRATLLFYLYVDEGCNDVGLGIERSEGLEASLIFLQEQLMALIVDGHL